MTQPSALGPQSSGSPQPSPRGSRFGQLARRTIGGLRPNQRMRWTREGVGYFLVWLGLLYAGWNQQVNLLMLVAGLAAGPLAANYFLSQAMVRGLRVIRRAPRYIFAGQPLAVDYTLENDRRWSAALALTLLDELAPVDRSVSGPERVLPRAFFDRVPGRSRGRLRWQGPSPRRGRYRFGTMDLVTRSPFGLMERRVALEEPGELVVYPAVGQLTRRWGVVRREATETRRGRRHDRVAQQQEYHGLRDYRPGDSPRWIHWRTTARLGEPMVKEFEQQNEQDLAVLLDPWLPRVKVAPEQREAVEEAIRFVATICFETCRQAGRRLLLGWTGPTPGVVQGPASVKLLHEMLEHLAVMRPATEGQLAPLFDALPPATLREAAVVIVSTRPVNLTEEAERSARLSGAAGRGLLGRALLLDAARGDLAGLIQYGTAPADDASARRPPPDAAADAPRRLRPAEPEPAPAPGPAPRPEGPAGLDGAPIDPREARP